MDSDRIKFVRHENGVDYYIDTEDTLKKEFGIPTKAIASAPRHLDDGRPPIQSRAHMDLTRSRANGCYSIGGVSAGD